MSVPLGLPLAVRTRWALLAAAAVGAACWLGSTTLALAQTVPAASTAPKLGAPATAAPTLGPVGRADDELQPVAPASTRAELLQRFMTMEPQAREHVLNLNANAYTDSEQRSPLRLKRMWVGRQWTLVEIEGLTTEAPRNFSAVIRFETFELVHAQGSAKLEAAEGATILQDRQGGRAITIKPGDSVLAMFSGTVDDLRPMRLQHTTPVGTYVYFDDMDPRFDERYDAAYRAAKVKPADPEAMKDFLVGFARKDPKGRVREVFVELIGAMRAENSFEGYYHAYLLLQDPSDARKASRLASKPEHQAMIENLAVATLAEKTRLIDFEVQISAGASQREEGSCWMFCRYNFRAIKQLYGQIQVKANKPGSPMQLRVGTYVAKFEVTVDQPRHYLRASNWLGSADRQEVHQEKANFSVTLAPPIFTASQAIRLPTLEIAFMQRGSAGGEEGHWATSDPTVTVRLKSLELKQ